MNRIQSRPGEALFPSSPAAHAVSPSVEVEQALQQSAAAGATPFALFRPLHYEPNYAYPLVVWLHGPGGDERQLNRIMPLVSMRNYAAVAPRGAASLDRLAGGRGFDWPQTPEGILAAEESVFDCLAEAEQRLHLHRQRVFIAGYDSGGAMALRIALRNPTAFAGALTIGGALPSGHFPLARLKAIRRLPLFIAFGRDAQRYSPHDACEDLKLAHSAGLAVALRQYPCGDEVTTKMLSDMDAWMMEHITGSPMTSDDELALPPGDIN